MVGAHGKRLSHGLKHGLKAVCRIRAHAGQPSGAQRQRSGSGRVPLPFYRSVPVVEVPTPSRIGDPVAPLPGIRFERGKTLATTVASTNLGLVASLWAPTTDLANRMQVTLALQLPKRNYVSVTHAERFGTAPGGLLPLGPFWKAQ